ncbi:MAG: hypothetical protein JRC68_00755 [Deltaproteobacteria bacterium]|nr:hypothetical protein [Deltaproteobacteria bacterium]
MKEIETGLKLEPGNVLWFVYVDVDTEKEADFNRWYDTEHEPLLRKVEGVIWNYNSINLSEGQKYLSLYVHKNIDVRSSSEYKAVSQTEWSKEIRPFVKNFEARNYKSVLTGPIPTNLKKGDIIRTVQVNVRPDHDEMINNLFDKEYIPLIKQVKGVIAVWQAVNLSEMGQKYITIYFLENIDVQKSISLEFISQKGSIESITPYLSDIFAKNYEVRI